MAVQLEIKKGFTLLELLAVLAISGMLILAVSGMLLPGNKDEQWLDLTLNSLVEQGIDLSEQTQRPHYLEVVTEDKALILKLVRQEDTLFVDVNGQVCPKGISLILERCGGYQVDGVNPIFPISDKGLEVSIVVFGLRGGNIEYRF